MLCAAQFTTTGSTAFPQSLACAIQLRSEIYARDDKGSGHV
jgi:hypothetical protein